MSASGIVGAVIGVIVALLILSWMGAIRFDGGTSTPKPPKQSLSDRINAACPKGYTPTDWETDGEFTNIPPDTVKVTCVAVNPNHEPNQIYRSVSR